MAVSKGIISFWLTGCHGDGGEGFRGFYMFSDSRIPVERSSALLWTVRYLSLTKTTFPPDTKVQQFFDTMNALALISTGGRREWKLAFESIVRDREWRGWRKLGKQIFDTSCLAFPAKSSPHHSLSTQLRRCLKPLQMFEITVVLLKGLNLTQWEQHELLWGDGKPPNVPGLGSVKDAAPELC